MSYCASETEGKETLKMIKHLEKGQFGYLSAQKKRNLIIMVIAFALVIACFIIGLVIFKDKNNILTVVSIVLVLPAAKFAVAYFILVPHTAAQRQLKEAVEKISGSLIVLYDLVLSNKVSPIGTQVVAITDTLIIALTNEMKADKKLFENSVKEFMQVDGCTVTVKLYTDEKSFLAKLNMLAKSNSNEMVKDFKKMQKNSASIQSMAI